MTALGPIPFDKTHRYPAVGKCIYCGDDTGKLGDEHIIPMSFGGNLLLPDASCSRCGKMTTRVEDHCVKGMISTARPHLGIKGRQKSKNALSRGPVYIEGGQHLVTKSAPLQDHPGTLIQPVFPYPSALLGLPLPEEDKDVTVRVAMKAMTPDIAARAAKFGRVTMTKGFAAIECYQLMAKIAHSFACAVLGRDNFEPYLLNLIRGEAPMYADHFVGSLHDHEPVVDELHELSIVPADLHKTEHIVVRVRLFANCDMPTHHIAVGRLK